jgi:NADPH:quinone reductase-like Zn-dependent oxidoreductase
VLIHAAAGGVGSVAVQLAKGRGARVIGTASARNHEFLRKMGVDQVVDYDTESFENVVQPVDVVLDTIGGDVQQRSWKVLKPGGILVSIASPPSAEAAAANGVRQAFVFTQPNAGQLAEIAALVDGDKLKAIVETILPLSDATRGQELSERGHTRGKIVLRVVN